VTPPAGPAVEVTDLDLVVRAREHDDVAAFEELVRRHRDRAYRVALRVCRDPTAAEDVAQEAFVRVWRGLHGFRADSQFSTWLYRIVTNLALNRVTRRREDPTGDVPEPAGRHLDPAVRAEDSERLGTALQALDALTPEQRACFVLREVEGLSYEELAEVLDTTVAGVKGRLFRAREELATALRAYDTGRTEEVAP